MAATLVVAVALLVASASLVVLLQRSLVAGAEQAAVARAEELLSLLPADGLGDEGSGVRQSLRAATASSTDRSSIAQVIAPGDTVIAASPDIDGEGPMSDVEPAPGTPATETGPLPIGDDDDEFQVVVLSGDRADGRYRVIVGQSLGGVTDSTEALGSLLAIGSPVLLLVVGAATFVFVGRSLQPVEAIRAKVAGIGGRQLSERVPVPRATDEVGRLAVTMNEMLDRLEAAQHSQRQFVADASHELRSPIATLRAGAEVALARFSDAGGSSTSGKGLADSTLAESIRLERLVDGLLLLARADERGLHVDRRDVDLDDLLVAEAERVRATRNLRVDLRITAVRVLADPHQIAQVIRNLVDNAARHANSELTLTLARSWADAVLEVIDDGPGVPQTQRNRVFDRFVRLDESRQRSSGGSGLGLAIVKEIVTAHGGTVDVTDRDDGSGARFVLTLPLPPAT